MCEISTREYRERNEAQKARAVMKVEEWQNELNLYRQLEEQDKFIYHLKDEISEKENTIQKLEAIIDEYQKNFGWYEVEDNRGTRFLWDGRKCYSVKIFLDKEWSFFRKFTKVFTDKFWILCLKNEKISFTIDFDSDAVPNISKYRIIPKTKPKKWKIGT